MVEEASDNKNQGQDSQEVQVENAKAFVQPLTTHHFNDQIQHMSILKGRLWADESDNEDSQTLSENAEFTLILSQSERKRRS